MNIIGSVSPMKLSGTIQRRYRWHPNPDKKCSFHKCSGSNSLKSFRNSEFMGCQMKAPIWLLKDKKPRHGASPLQVSPLVFMYCQASP